MFIRTDNFRKQMGNFLSHQEINKYSSLDNKLVSRSHIDNRGKNSQKTIDIPFKQPVKSLPKILVFKLQKIADNYKLDLILENSYSNDFISEFRLLSSHETQIISYYLSRSQLIQMANRLDHQTKINSQSSSRSWHINDNKVRCEIKRRRGTSFLPVCREQTKKSISSISEQIPNRSINFPELKEICSKEELLLSHRTTVIIDMEFRSQFSEPPEINDWLQDQNETLQSCGKRSRIDDLKSSKRKRSSNPTYIHFITHDIDEIQSKTKNENKDCMTICSYQLCQRSDDPRPQFITEKIETYCLTDANIRTLIYEINNILD